MRFSRAGRVVVGVAAAVALGAGLLWYLTSDGPWRDREVRHDEVTAWLTCHSFLRDSVPEATLLAAPWEASRENVRRLEEATYWAAGTAAMRDDSRREAQFECVLEWVDGGWRLHSLNAVVVPAVP